MSRVSTPSSSHISGGKTPSGPGGEAACRSLHFRCAPEGNRGGHDSLPRESSERRAIRDGYVWLDWLCIPQDGKQDPDRLRAIKSIPIPSCVDSCKVFVSLVPRVPHESGNLPTSSNKFSCSFERKVAVGAPGSHALTGCRRSRNLSGLVADAAS